MSSRSDPTAERDLFVPQAGMLVYEHDNDNLYNSTYGSNEEQGYGFWHGSLNHMQLGRGKGFLISLMGETAIAGVTRPDAPEVNDETGIPVSLDSVSEIFGCSSSKGSRLDSTMSCFTISTGMNGISKRQLISMTICRSLEPVSVDKLFTARTQIPGSMSRRTSYR